MLSYVYAYAMPPSRLPLYAASQHIDIFAGFAILPMLIAARCFITLMPPSQRCSRCHLAAAIFCRCFHYRF